jgi:hypothetical protein
MRRHIERIHVLAALAPQRSYCNSGSSDSGHEVATVLSHTMMHGMIQLIAQYHCRHSHMRNLMPL